METHSPRKREMGTDVLGQGKENRSREKGGEREREGEKVREN